MLREAGALEIHVRISSPPVQWPCFYGIDFATRAELIATGLGVEEIRASIGADSLGYISEEGMIAATNQPEDRLCTACFTGRYPIELPEDGQIGKHVFETLPLDVRTGHDRSVDVDGVTPRLGFGGGNALQHPRSTHPTPLCRLRSRCFVAAGRDRIPRLVMVGS
mgnify:CR=1 FL=1